MSRRTGSWTSTGAAAALLLTLGGCGGEPQPEPGAAVPPVQWDTATVHVLADGDTLPLRVEVSETDEQRAFGLMLRDSLPQDAGMLFVYPADQPAEGAFWMFNTRIPLDIAYLDADGRIVSIRQMEPCTSPYPEWCPTYESGAPFRSALEVNRGWFAAHGVEVGDRVEGIGNR